MDTPATLVETAIFILEFLIVFILSWMSATCLINRIPLRVLPRCTCQHMKISLHFFSYRNVAYVIPPIHKLLDMNLTLTTTPTLHYEKHIVVS